MSDPFANSPVLLWQMGKVGSTSISLALQEAGLRPIQLHVLDPDRIERVVREYEDGGFVVPDHIEDARRLQSLIADPDAKLRIISLVRDPVARNLSALFETWDEYPPELGDDHDPAKLAEWFVMNFDYSVLDWFDHEIKARTGLDICDVAFDPDSRQLVIETDRIRVLVLRSEDPQSLKEQCLERFLGLAKISLGYSNRSICKPQATLWRQMSDAAKVSSILANIVYGSRLVRHFYSVDEVATFRARWAPSRDGIYFEPGPTVEGTGRSQMSAQ